MRYFAIDVKADPLVAVLGNMDPIIGVITQV